MYTIKIFPITGLKLLYNSGNNRPKQKANKKNIKDFKEIFNLIKRSK